MRKIHLFDNEHVKVSPDLKIAVYYESDGLEELLHEEQGKEIVRRSDVAILLNQKLLEKRNVSPLAVQRFVDGLRRSSSDILRNQPDSVLSSIVKSRYVQSPADVYRYNQTINRDLSKLEKDVQDYKEQQAAAQAAAEQQQTNVESSTTE